MNRPSDSTNRFRELIWQRDVAFLALGVAVLLGCVALAGQQRQKIAEIEQVQEAVRHHRRIADEHQILRDQVHDVMLANQKVLQGLQETRMP